MERFMKYTYRIIGVLVLTFALWGSLKTEAGAVDVTEIKQTASTEKSVSIEWSAVEGADRYECSLSDGLSENITQEVTGTDCTFSDLTAGTSYYLLISAYQGDTQVAASPDVYEVVTSPDVSAFTVVQTDAKTTSVEFAMTGAVGANYYIVQETGDSTSQIAAGEADKVTVEELKTNKRYTYRVYAVRKSGNGFSAYNAEAYKDIVRLYDVSGPGCRLYHDLFNEHIVCTIGSAAQEVK